MEDFGLLIARYNSGGVSLTDGHLSELQVDSSGRLLVQADVSVIIDYLGLNGAGDSSNVLMAGTEDGTGGGTAHALRVDTGGQLIISDGGSSITVDATDLDIRDLSHTTDSISIGDGTDLLSINVDGSINITDNGGSLTVDATDLDIRDLSASQDNVAISDGTEQLEINADGSINSQATVVPIGTEAYTVSDAQTANEDGLITITASGTPWVDVASLSVGSGTTAYVYGWQWGCDQNAVARLVTDDGTNLVVYKVSLNTSAMPEQSQHWSEPARIEIPGAASLNLKLQIRKRSATNGDANGTGSIHVRTV